MQNLHFSTTINASKEKVWKTMLEDTTYRQWTNVFNPTGGSYYEGEWKTESNMRFIGPDIDGNIGGMISRIKEARPYDFVSIQHIGVIEKGQEKIMPHADDAEVGLENYTFNDKDGTTELLIDLIGLPDEYQDMFKEMWPKALVELKNLAEK